MHTDLTLIGVDSDGAIQETAERAGINRGDLLKRGAIGGGALFGAASLLGAIPGAAFASSSSIRGFSRHSFVHSCGSARSTLFPFSSPW